jgi:hypothetical protein
MNNKERIKLESSILPCIGAELCDFLHIEKKEILTSQDVRKNLKKALTELRELKELTKTISELETEIWKLKSLYIKLLDEEYKEEEIRIWGKKMKTFKEKTSCQ